MPSPGTASRHNRVESERFKCYTCIRRLKLDKVKLDIFRLKGDALEESANLPDPEIMAQEITDDFVFRRKNASLLLFANCHSSGINVACCGEFASRSGEFGPAVTKP